MKAPFPYFGGKARIAEVVWRALSEVRHYIEPFCGSAAVLLARPNHDPTRHVETVNDADGHIANVWRSLQADPDEVAKWCDWPVNHADLIARKKKLNLNAESLLSKLIDDDEYYDPKLAGYYIWAASCWIGSGLVCGNQTPHISDAGMGVHSIGNRPHLSTAGMGVHGIGNKPHLSDAGMGVQEPYNTPIYDWFRDLSERLRNVRVVCGDWTQVCGGNWQDNIGTVGVFFDPPYALKIDQKYNRARVYSQESETVAEDVRRWCLERGDRDSYRIVLAGYDGEHDELESHGWSVHKWHTSGGYGKTKRSDDESNGQANRERERLWMSPHCSPVDMQTSLFGE